MSKERKSGHANWNVIPADKVATIMALHADKKTPLQISIATKVYSVDAVRRVLSQNGVSFAVSAATLTEEQTASAKAMWFEGMGAKEIGATFGISQERVYRLRAEQEWPNRPNVKRPRPSSYLPDKSDPKAGTLPLLALGRNHCRWPCGDPKDDDFSFCGRRAEDGPYCVRHGRVAFLRCEAAA